MMLKYLFCVSLIIINELEKIEFFRGFFKFINELNLLYFEISPDQEIQIFFEKCWSNEPSERPDFPEILQTIKSTKFKLAFQSDEKELYNFLKYLKEKLENSIFENLLFFFSFNAFP